MSAHGTIHGVAFSAHDLGNHCAPTPTGFDGIAVMTLRQLPTLALVMRATLRTGLNVLSSGSAPHDERASQNGIWHGPGWQGRILCCDWLPFFPAKCGLSAAGFRPWLLRFWYVSLRFTALRIQYH